MGLGRIGGASWLALAVACSGGADPAGAPDAGRGGVHPRADTLDAVVEALHAEAGTTPIEADPAELCRRLYVDLVGRFPSADEVARDCAGRPVGEVVDALQATDAYVAWSMRWWRDRLETSDTRADFRYLKDLFDEVAALHRGELDYRAFVATVASHPGFVVLDDDPEDRARRAYRVFFGVAPTDGVASDLGALYRVWDVRETVDPDVFPALRRRAYLVAGRCDPASRCQTRLANGEVVTVRTPRGVQPFDAVPWENLREEEREGLAVTGRFFTTDPRLEEALADALLDRLLGWSDGGRTPRRAGDLHPDARAILAAHLAETGDVRSAERMLLASWFYRASATVDEARVDAPVWAVGPVKHTPAEALVSTVLGLSDHRGTCDPRYPDDYLLEELRDQLVVDGGVESFEESVGRLAAQMESFAPIVMTTYLTQEGEEVVVRDIDGSFRTMAQRFGGCPGSQSPRLSGADGLSIAAGQEIAAELLCRGREGLVPGAAVDVGDVVAHQMRRFYGRDARDDERAALEGLACPEASCLGAEAAERVCVALVGGLEMLFY